MMKPEPRHYIESGLVIRSFHDPEREARAIQEWWRRNSLIAQARRLTTRDEALAQRLAQHAERWGWVDLMDAARYPVECPTCDGVGRFGDVLCPRCAGEGKV